MWRERKPGGEEGGVRVWWMFAGIMAVAAAVRLWRLGSLPPGIFRDEAEKALNGWFLLQGGTDAAGNSWPLFIKVFGVTTSAIYQYAVVPFLAVGGLNEWTARMPAAVAGVATVAVTWSVARRLWGWRAAVCAAGLLAISPWHVPLSRWAQQGVFLPLCFAGAAWGLASLRQLRITNYELRITNYELRIEGFASQTDDGIEANGDTEVREERAGTKDKGEDAGGGWGLLVVAGCLALAMYAYDPARLFAPLLGLAAVVLWWRVWVQRWRVVIAAGVVFAVCVAPVGWLMLNEGAAAQARFRFLSVFQPGVSMGEGLGQFVRNYFSHFSPDFLLVNGDAELRHSGGVGMLNLTELLLAVMGAVVAVWRRSRFGMFFVLWILLSPVAASLTRIGVPHALRSQVALPAWQLLAGFGFSELVQRVGGARRRMVQQLVTLGILLGAMPFFLSYFGGYGARSAGNWQYGVKQSLQFMDNPPTRDSLVFFHNVVGAEYLVPFYRQMDRPMYMAFMGGRSRFKVMPFQPPDRDMPERVEGKAAWVTPPGYAWPGDYAPVPITAPGGEETPPVMLIMMNPELTKQVRAQSAR